MCLDEFIDIFKKCDLIGENLAEKDLNLCFNLSIMVNNIKSDISRRALN